MPSSSPKQLEKWSLEPNKATKFLQERGYVLTPEWIWLIPTDAIPTAEELDAITYLEEEWDYGGFGLSLIVADLRPLDQETFDRLKTLESVSGPDLRRLLFGVEYFRFMVIYQSYRSS